MHVREEALLIKVVPNESVGLAAACLGNACPFSHNNLERWAGIHFILFIRMPTGMIACVRVTVRGRARASVMYCICIQSVICRED